MDIKNPIFGLVACIFIFLVTASSVRAGEEPPFRLRVEFDDVTIPFYPLDVKFHLANGGDELITLVLFPPEGAYIRVETDTGDLIYDGASTGPLVTEDGKRENVSIVPPPPVNLRGGDVQAFVVSYKSRWDVLGRGPRGPIFSEPGVYEIVLSVGIFYRGDDGKQNSVLLKTRPRELTVRKEGEHAEALEAIRTISDKNLLLDPKHVVFAAGKGGDRLGAWDHELEAYLHKHPDAPWTPLAWLARSYIAQAQGKSEMKGTFARRAAASAKEKGLTSVRQEALQLAPGIREAARATDKATPRYRGGWLLDRRPVSQSGVFSIKSNPRGRLTSPKGSVRFSQRGTPPMRTSMSS